MRSQASAHAVATFIQSTAVVEAEKAATGTSLKAAAKIAASPNDALVAQGKDLCVGELA